MRDRHTCTVADISISGIAAMCRLGKNSCMSPEQDRWFHERKMMASQRQRIAGVDEAGRGPLAGAVFAAAVVLPIQWILLGMPDKLIRLNDSKQLTAAQREIFFELLTRDSEVQFSVASVEASEIDRVNILQATHQAMRRALGSLNPSPDYALVDGNPVPELPVPHTSIIQGDARSYSIAAASVLAKVTRDREMDEADRNWPEYGFARHKGYGTPEHLAALAQWGPCPIHRRSFAPLNKKQPDLFAV